MRDMQCERWAAVLEVASDDMEPDDSPGTASLDLRPGCFLKLTVRDTGHGIPPEVQEHIFEPYFTTKPPGEGTGLGLAVVHGIVKNYGGYITVRSTPDVGTTVEVLLPVVQDDPGFESTIGGCAARGE